MTQESVETFDSISVPEPALTTERWTGYAAAFATLVLWSGTAVANKIAVGHMDGLTAGVLRSMIAGLFALGIAFALRLPFPRRPHDLAKLATAGVCNFAAWPIFMSIGVARTTAGHTALIMAIIPIFTVLGAATIVRRRPHAGWWFGAAIAFAGTVLLIAGRTGSGADGATATGDLIVLAGTVICACGYIAGGSLSPKIGTFATTFWSLAVALVVLVPIFAAIAGHTDWRSVPLNGWLAIGWMSIFSSLAGYAFWFYALGHTGIGRIGSTQMAMPVVTLAASAVILGETLTMLLLTACATIILGTFWAQRHAH